MTAWSRDLTLAFALADAAGISVFATGGIGGVHRGAEVTGDVSADLGAIARHPLVTVCAGAKAFLDLPRTLEELERRYLEHVLKIVHGNKSQAARILGYDRRTLYRKLERMETTHRRLGALASEPDPLPQEHPVNP